MSMLLILLPMIPFIIALFALAVMVRTLVRVFARHTSAPVSVGSAETEEKRTPPAPMPAPQAVKSEGITVPATAPAPALPSHV